MWEGEATCDGDVELEVKVYIDSPLANDPQAFLEVTFPNNNAPLTSQAENITYSSTELKLEATFPGENGGIDFEIDAEVNGESSEGDFELQVDGDSLDCELELKKDN